MEDTVEEAEVTEETEVAIPTTTMTAEVMATPMEAGAMDVVTTTTTATATAITINPTSSNRNHRPYRALQQALEPTLNPMAPQVVTNGSFSHIGRDQPHLVQGILQGRLVQWTYREQQAILIPIATMIHTTCQHPVTLGEKHSCNATTM